MIIPVRCFTCGRLIASEFEAFKKRTEEGQPPKQVLDDVGLKLFCCRRMVLSHVDLLSESARYE